MSEIQVAGTNILDVKEPSEEIVMGNISVDPDTQASDPLKYKQGDGYDKIEIPDSALFGEQPDPDTEQAVTTESQEEPTSISESDDGETDTVSDNSEGDTLVYTADDGTEYTSSDIDNWRTDSLNKAEWQKSNTEKAQEVAQTRKSMEPFMKLMGKFRKSEEFADTVKEAVVDEFGDEAGQLFEQSLKMEMTGNSEEPETTVEPQEVSELKAKNRQLENELALNTQVSELMIKHSLDSDGVDKVLSFAVEHQEKTGTLLSPEDAYKVMNFDKVKPVPKKKPSVPVNVKKGVGVKSESSKKPFTNYEDIDISGFFK